MNELENWVGRSESRLDHLHPTPVRALRATLDLPDAPVEPGQPLPPLWHWLYFLPLHRACDIGPDGHARRGGFLPPVPLPRRMWAGSRFVWHAPLRVGDGVTRTSTIESVSAKAGRSGPLVFVTVRHELQAQGQAEPALTEWHDIVYREAPTPGAAAAPAMPAPAQASWRRELVPDDVLLFRYSALTFNGHRIHYDRRYVTQEEGYPGLVVHGPLVATLLLDLLHRHAPDATVRRLAFTARSPAFDGRPLHLAGQPGPDGPDGRTVQLWAHDATGALHMDAHATLAPGA